MKRLVVKKKSKLREKKDFSFQKSLIDKYDINSEMFDCKSIKDSCLSGDSQNFLIDNNIITLLDLISMNLDNLENFSGYRKSYGREIQNYLFEIENEIINNLSDFSPLEEWDMFLDAVNELMSLNPLTCVLCGENPSAISMNIAEQVDINICEECSNKIKENIYSFLSEKCLW